MIPLISSFDEYKTQYANSIAHPEAFWASIGSYFQWIKPWDQVLQWNFDTPEIQWFKGAKLNITENCIDRHLATQGNNTAIIWEPNNPSDKPVHLTYNQLHAQVCRLGNVLKGLGVEKGDRVCIYLPMIPEAVFAMLACARIGAVHSVVFAGFSSQSLADRINDSQARLVITADGFYRGDKAVNLKQIVDTALEQTSSVVNTLVVKHTGWETTMNPVDLDYAEQMSHASDNCPAEPMDAEDPLFILYTSGSTGKPKGILHTQAGYMVYAGYSFRQVFRYQPGQVYWCTADVGWVTGHTYLLYGPLLNGGTTLVFEGVPSWPDAGRFWEVVQRHKVNVFYTAPTAIRSLMFHGTGPLEGKDLSSLKVLGTVGEPINEEAWEWYHREVGKEKCPVVDTWWQTETGGILISPLAGITPLKPGYATFPLPGIQPVLVDARGDELQGNGQEGNLCIKFPWPGMARSIYGDLQRFHDTYFSAYPGKYFTGDGCKRDEEGFYRITGRVDDVINVSGHRIGTGEVENAINEHPAVVESAVVGFPHDIKGQGIYAYVICSGGHSADLVAEIREQVGRQIGAFAKPDKIQVVSGLPKTRSGKIMRRILRKIAEGDTSNLGDTSTLLDPAIVDIIKQNAV